MTGFKSELAREINPVLGSTVRVGASVTAGAGVGTLGVEGVVSAGIEGDGEASKAFISRAVGNVTVSPVLPKVQGEIKVNVLEVIAKPPKEKSK